MSMSGTAADRISDNLTHRQIRRWWGGSLTVPGSGSHPGRLPDCVPGSGPARRANGLPKTEENHRDANVVALPGATTVVHSLRDNDNRK
jgi:hypothetical protein